MSRTSIPFEEQLKSAVENFDYPYDATSWSHLERRLKKENITRSNQAGLVAMLAATVTILLGSWGVYNTYFNIPDARMAAISNRFAGIELPISGGKFTTNPSQVNSANSLMVENAGIENNNENNTSVLSAGQMNYANNQERDNHFHTDKTSNLADVPLIDEPATKSTASFEKSALLFTPSQEETCTGYSVDFSVTNGPKDGKYLWNFGDGTFSTEPTPKHEYGSPGTYDVSLSITKNGVIKSTTMDNMITINPAPDANFEWDFILNGEGTVPVKFVNTSTYANESIWKFSSTDGSTEISPVETFAENGKHKVELKVINEFGCSDIKTKTVCINADDLIPYGQKFDLNKNGKPNVFMPEALASNNYKFRMMLYNNGDKIYETSNNHKGWDGKLPDGTIAQEGQVFTWVVVIENLITKEDKLYSGDLTIIP